MIKIQIPNFGDLKLEHLVLDYNGTLALDGKLVAGVEKRLIKLAQNFQIHFLTADTFGKAASQLEGIPAKLHILKKNNEALQKEDYVKLLGSENVVAVGNGNNDRSMIKTAALGIAVIGTEGCANAAIQAADIIVTDINHGLELLLNPLRCKATLRF
jgi:P-type E1-E2 ATPase